MSLRVSPRPVSPRPVSPRIVSPCILQNPKLNFKDPNQGTIILICPVRDNILVEKTIYNLIKCRQVRYNQYLQV
jgi:hypothetical protein